MQQPAYFREERPEVMHALMRANPLATLITQQDALTADHIPMVLDVDDGKAVLRGHIAANNPLARSGVDTLDALAVFQGPHAYVSPSWYASKAEHGRVVPTWNYAAVHASGPMRFIRDADWLTEQLSALSDENERGRAEPWALSDAPEDYVAGLLRAIVGVELRITALSGVWKMSQNKRGADHFGVVTGLVDDGADDVAELVRTCGDRKSDAR